ncbi:hypothetical protein [Chryseobacterium sp. KMC2]|uniref:hypothetical protein n=1 Tax=Chryseobacterium sp. KMC2 TaxID=2800705 RepID=UPI0019207F19|nr:hypothetical protein [Chryseobacterium sp. KMC2]MBL3550311.1 hypothetical protein [Chryseobacterium sp. KMC2]
MEELFNSYFLSEGGIYRSESTQIKEIIELANIIIRRVRTQYPLLPEIYFNIIDNNTFNAKAALDVKNGNIYYIGVYAGLINILFDVFTKTNIVRELDLNEEVKLSITSTKSTLEFDHSKGFSESISNVDIIALDRYRLIFEFLIYHEICHILRGHIAFKQSKKISELQGNFKEYSDLNINFIQTLEMDADSFATSWVIGDFRRFTLKTELTENTIYKNWETFIPNFAYSIYTTIRIFGFSSLPISKIKTFTHPEPAIRISLIMSNIATILDALNVDNIDDIMSNSIHMLKRAETDVVSVTFLDDQLENVKDVYFNPEYIKYYKQVLHNWNIIRDELQSYAFGELPGKNFLTF